MTRDGKIYYVCDNNHHLEKQWCFCKDCMNRPSIKRRKEGERASKGEGKTNSFSSDFRVALAAMCNDADSIALES